MVLSTPMPGSKPGVLKRRSLNTLNSYSVPPPTPPFHTFLEDVLNSFYFTLRNRQPCQITSAISMCLTSRGSWLDGFCLRSHLRDGQRLCGWLFSFWVGEPDPLWRNWADYHHLVKIFSFILKGLETKKTMPEGGRGSPVFLSKTAAQFTDKCGGVGGAFWKDIWKHQVTRITVLMFLF